MAALGYENIRRLDVTMNDSALMRGIQRVSDFNSKPQDLVDV